MCGLRQSSAQETAQARHQKGTLHYTTKRINCQGMDYIFIDYGVVRIPSNSGMVLTVREAVELLSGTSQRKGPTGSAGAPSQSGDDGAVWAQFVDIAKSPRRY
jgi:hypothetical protein